MLTRESQLVRVTRVRQLIEPVMEPWAKLPNQRADNNDDAKGEPQVFQGYNSRLREFFFGRIFSGRVLTA